MAVVLLLLTFSLLLLPLWESVIVLWFVVRYFMSILVLQSSWWGRESWLLCLICLYGVSWWLSGSSSRCHGVVCSLWLWYFLIILTYYSLLCNVPILLFSPPLSLGRAPMILKYSWVGLNRAFTQLINQTFRLTWSFCWLPIWQVPLFIWESQDIFRMAFDVSTFAKFFDQVTFGNNILLYVTSTAVIYIPFWIETLFSASINRIVRWSQQLYTDIFYNTYRAWHKMLMLTKPVTALTLPFAYVDNKCNYAIFFTVSLLTTFFMLGGTLYERLDPDQDLRPGSTVRSILWWCCKNIFLKKSVDIKSIK